MKKFALFAFAAGALASVVAATNTKCPAQAPCSREGQCDSGPMFCMFALCNPTLSYNSTSCWKPEGCANQNVGFDSVNDAIAIRSYGGNPNVNPLVSIFEPNNAVVSGGSLVLQMKYNPAQKKGFGSTVDSSNTMQYGQVTARIKTASVAKGVVSAFIIRNDQVGDEIDFEWVGKSPNQVQTNYYYHDIPDYNKKQYFDIGSDTSADFHDYTINWTPDAITWIVDGKALRTLSRKDTYDSASKVYKFPAAEGRVGLSIWDGGSAATPGTQNWAGFPTPWTNTTVYKMYVDSVSIQCPGGVTPPSSTAVTSVASTTATSSKATTTAIASTTSAASMTTAIAATSTTNATSTVETTFTPASPAGPSTLLDTNAPLTTSATTSTTTSNPATSTDPLATTAPTTITTTTTDPLAVTTTTSTTTSTTSTTSDKKCYVVYRTVQV